MITLPFHLALDVVIRYLFQIFNQNVYDYLFFTMIATCRTYLNLYPLFQFKILNTQNHRK
jgi:hypothetical protein